MNTPWGRKGHESSRVALDAPPVSPSSTGTMDAKKPKKPVPARNAPKSPPKKSAPKAPARAPAKVASKAPDKGGAKKATVKKATARKAAAGKAPAPKSHAKEAPRAGSKAPRRKLPARPPLAEGLDPDGYFVARIRGEDAARRAPHAMTEGEEREDVMSIRALAEVPVPPDDEGLGELPWSYGDDVFVGLPRDPRTLFFYWDHSPATMTQAFEWLDRPRAQLRVFGMRTDGEWELVRTADFALESRGFYVHDLEPGRSYRGEIHAVSLDGRERPVGEPSNEVALPSSGPSSTVDDRFAVIPWELPLDSWLREVSGGGAFPEALRSLLARLSAGSPPSAPAWQVRAEDERPSSPTKAWGSPGKRRGKGKKGDS
jgi:hypothetical protein